MKSDFILDLQRKRSNYSHPDQATSQANSLVLLSSGIYTEEERFVFELLQNAVDAHNSNTSCLDVKIMLEDDYLIFMHNGEAFTERDIEGLCDVGNGNKMNDVKKIGYKGVGFKSVFMRSNNVTVQSGGYCFKFDKNHWNNYWDLHWNKSEYGERDSEKKYSMPWQIIPIETNPPLEVDVNGYNVITFIQLARRGSIEQKILRLFANNQFLLFLKSDNIKMSFSVDGVLRQQIEKVKDGSKAILFSNGVESSKWLLHINDKVEVPSCLKDAINADINTPDKLKNANTFDLSFAIALDKNQLRRLSKEESLIFTYLPTSYRFGAEGFPFLVNANFITDAGRQQLHKDSEWNKLIFSRIPSEYLTWMKQLSTDYKNYWEVLPEKSYGNGNPLEQIYEDNMKKAIDEIAFIPCFHDPAQKVLASDAFMDRIGISDAISVKSLVGHINRTYSLSYQEEALVENVWRGSKILSSYGVFIFDKQKIHNLFEDNSVFENISISMDIKLLDFLYAYYLRNHSEQDELKGILNGTRFLFNEHLELNSPGELFYPSSYKDQNKLADGVNMLNQDIYDTIQSRPELIAWLSSLGVESLSDISFINNVISCDGYVTNENVIEIGKFLFQVYQKEDLFGEVSKFKLNNILFKTKGGNLKFIKNLYLSSDYKPELDLEAILDEDIFISEKYCEDSSIAEWKVFLLKMGANEDIINKEESITLYGTKYNERYDKSFFDKIKNTAERYGWLTYDGWCLKDYDYRFSASEVSYHTFPFISNCNSYSFSRLVFSRLLSKFDSKGIQTKVISVRGSTGLYSRSIHSSMLSDLGCKIDHFKWIIENCSVIPTVKHDCRKSTDVYSNAIPNINEIAGDYLPIIDVDEEVTDSWQSYLSLKTYLTVEDYLTLLTEFASDPDNASSNKSKVTNVYQKLVEHGVLESENCRKQLIEWSLQNSILSENNIFISPSELSYVTLDGFSSKNRVYIGNPSNKEKVIELLALMGVKIITSESIKTEFESKTESFELKNILKDKVSPLALIASGVDATDGVYTVNKEKLQSLIQNTYYYHCKSIKLSYGDSDDVIIKHTFGNNNEFYFTGELRPASIEPLLTPLCKYLGISGKERELFIMFFETMDAIKQNLKDKGYNVELIEDEPVVGSGTINLRLDYHPDEAAQQRNMITGFKGEILVYEMLISLGYLPECQSICSVEDECHTNRVEMNGKVYYCSPNYDKYDIKFVSKKGKEIYLEVKATTWSKQSQENMPISYRELSMVEDCSSKADKEYFIVRIFDIDTISPDIYIFRGNILDNGNISDIIEC